MTERLSVLIADDNASDRMILRAIVRRLGHDVIEAEDGQQAVQLFASSRPDIVLMDVFMPNMDGQQAAWIIKQQAGEELVPVIFLTSLTDADQLADCLDAGGDDFLSKPYNRVILQAKIQAFARMRTLHAQVQAQREHLVREQAVAKAVFDSIAHHGALDLPNIRYLISPMSVFNGDVMLVARQPSGGLSIFLGDFTGHGLPAAIGTMPLSEIFYGMTSKGFSLRDIAAEINRKLKSILPVGIFCCANLLDLSFRNRTIEVWTGGMPDNVIFNRRTKEIKRLVSHHLALGVLGPDRFRYDPYFIEMDPDDVVYLWSDGIPETNNMAGEMFGEDRLLEVFSRVDGQHIFDGIVRSVQSFSGQQQQSDDHTLLEIAMLEEKELPDMDDVAVGTAKNLGASHWRMDFELKDSSLIHFDPLPLLTHMIMEAPGLKRRASQVYTLLAELYSNALDHGVLRLDSGLKRTPDGFAEYYRLRTERLQQLNKAKICFRLAHEPSEVGGVLFIEVEDSGPGFDYQAATFAPHAEGYCGRGLPLVRSLCASFEYRGKGNHVCAEYRWE
ncbi:MAG: fused response regulator/phosphatase [Pseudomonadales bacterium]|nr:fused response regulator/phosphatase [Pseudomonadales bacterium]